VEYFNVDSFSTIKLLGVQLVTIYYCRFNYELRCTISIKTV